MQRRSAVPTLSTFRSYPSAVLLVHRSQEARTWALGSDLYLKESPNKSRSVTPRDEYAVLEHIQDRTTIPVPIPYMEYVDDNEIHFLIRSAIKGESLDRLWESMSWQEKEKIADQTAAYLRQLRGLTAPHLGRLDNQPLVDHFMFNTVHFDPHGPFTTADELWQAMAATLGQNVPQMALDRLGTQMPETAPFTFTHGDLTLGNIIVKDGNVVGLIDWEWSGYFPVWWEYVKLKLEVGRKMDQDWVELLEQRLDCYPEALEFMRKFRKLALISATTDPQLMDQGYQVIQELIDVLSAKHYLMILCTDPSVKTPLLKPF
ncbi:kinase-like domain-containing protein [Geopyxis carbonaria]|nr:kinase-like domain-containing protein [Geopyxis carbonaria]